MEQQEGFTSWDMDYSYNHDFRWLSNRFSADIVSGIASCRFNLPSGRTKILLKESKSFKVQAMLTKPSQTITVYLSSVSDIIIYGKFVSCTMKENYAGVTVTHSYKPKLPTSAYPVMDTRPLTAVVSNLYKFWIDSDWHLRSKMSWA